MKSSILITKEIFKNKNENHSHMYNISDGHLRLDSLTILKYYYYDTYFKSPNTFKSY